MLAWEGISLAGVHLPWSVAEGIEAQARSASLQFGDAHGILVGSALGTEFRVESFRAGELHAWPGAIGFYRSHRRPGLQTSAADAELVLRLFPQGRALLLLVKPLSALEAVGAFFHCEDGVILEPGTSSQEFSFVRPVEAAPAVKRRVKSGRWLIPSAIVAGIAAAFLVHCSGAQSDENPVSQDRASRVAYPINSFSDTSQPKPAGQTAASSSSGK